MPAPPPLTNHRYWIICVYVKNIKFYKAVICGRATEHFRTNHDPEFGSNVLSGRLEDILRTPLVVTV